MLDLKKSSWSLYWVNYGESLCQGNFLSSAKDDKLMTLIWSFFVLKGSSRLIMIDTGFLQKEFAEKFGVKLQDPFPALASIGIRPEDVTDIVITHHHFDHAGNIPLFPNAQVFMQTDEYELYRRELPGNPEIDKARLNLFESEYNLDGILMLKRIGAHTPGSLELSMDYDGTKYVFTGDECYLLENYLKRVPTGFAFNPDLNREYILSMPDGLTLMPFHDSLLFERYPRVAEGIVRVFPQEGSAK